MSSFFTIPKQKKRKLHEGTEPPKKRIASKKPTRESRPAPRKPQRDESISGSDDESDGPGNILEDDAATSGSSEGEEEETAAERRLKLAERYLQNVREEVVDTEGFDAEEIDRDLIAERLQDDVAESKGRMYRKLAEDLDFDIATHSWFRWNSQSVTSVATCAPWVYTVTKDLGLVKWRIQELPENQWLPKDGRTPKKTTPPPKRKPEQVAFRRGDKSKAKDNAYEGHVDTILTVAASQDGKFVVTGGKDRRIVIWEAETLKPLRVFTHHRDAVTGLAFRRGTNQMYSASKDRTVKIWSLDELAFVETLFGHQDEVVDISALAQERCISVGARDRTARLWKVVEETQLVFRGGGGEKKKKHDNARVQEGSIDRVAMIDEETFVTGSDNGSLSLWVIHKKKPIFTMPLCHGTDPALKPEEASAEKHPGPEIVPEPQPRWITALTTIPYSDVILTGSWDGEVRAWKVSEDKKKIEAVGIIGASGIVESQDDKQGESTVRGIVNDISVFERGDRGKDGVCVVVAVGKEHRLGRWQNKNHGKNGAVVFEIPRAGKEKPNGVEGSDNGDEVMAST